MKREQVALLVSRLTLVCLIFAFAGWVWETIHVSILAGELVDRGFLFGPICPIYGLTMIVAYFALGTPKNPRGVLWFTSGKWYRYMIYAIASIILPTIIEFVVGLSFDAVFGIRLWDYSHYVITFFGTEIPLHFKGYIALPISLIWLVLLFVSMGFFFPLFLKLMEKIPPKVTKITALVLISIMAIDVIASSIVSLLF